MPLGRMYVPSGLALETARVVLGVEEPYAINVAMGCSNGCPHCYGPNAFKHKDWTNVRCATLKNLRFIRKDIEKYKPEGVFLCFSTDPFIDINAHHTMFLAGALTGANIKYATLSKMAYSGCWDDANHMVGKTLVAFRNEYWKKHEPNADAPTMRLVSLKKAEHPWISCEPFPVPAIFEQNTQEYLSMIKDIKPELIVFGKWNYDKRANTKEAKVFYQITIAAFREFCERNKIKLHVKSDTLKFIGELK